MNDGDLVLLHQMADAARQLLGHAARAFDHRVQIIADAVGLQPEFLGAVHQVEHLGRAQQRLGRDAAPVQADAAQMLALDDGDVQAQLRAADRGDIAARPGTDYDHVKDLGGHGRLPPVSRISLTLNYLSTARNRQACRGECRCARNAARCTTRESAQAAVSASTRRADSRPRSTKAASGAVGVARQAPRCGTGNGRTGGSPRGAPGVQQVAGAAFGIRVMHQPHAAVLIAQVFRMHQRHVEELPRRFVDLAGPSPRAIADLGRRPRQRGRWQRPRPCRGTCCARTDRSG